MAVDVIMPQMGESIFEGTITKWLKKPGDKVERDEPLFEISTDKVDAEIPAPAAGVLKEIKINEGQTVPIQTVVAVIDAAGAATTAAPAAAPAAPAKAEAPPTAAKPAAKSQAPAPAAAKESASSAAKKNSAAVLAASSAAPAEAEAPAPVPAPTQTTAPDNGKRIHSSPLVRRLARESNIDLSTISGTGAGGRISKNDIQAAIAGGGAKSAPAGATPAGAAAPSGTAASTGTTTPAGAPKLPSGPGGQAAQVAIESAVPRERMYFGKYTVQPMSMMRQKIAEHMVASKRVSPHVYSVDEADMTKVAAARAQSKGEFETRYGTKLTFMPFFMRASVEALRAFPTLNSSIDGTNIVLHNDINLGIAVSLENGLIVPVVRNAEEKNFLGLQRSVNDLAERARSKKLKPEEVQEGTFAITNPGIYGGLMGLAVINQPNVAILGIGAIQKRVVVIDDAIAIRSMVYLTLSYDHRVVDGATAHQFIGKLKSVLEEWNEPLV